MSESSSESRLQHNSTSAHIALGAGLISSTLFFVGAGIIAVGCFLASTQALSAIKEGSDDGIRVMFWGGLSFFNVVVFNICGILGLKKVMRGYRELERLAKADSPQK